MAEKPKSYEERRALARASVEKTFKQSPEQRGAVNKLRKFFGADPLPDEKYPAQEALKRMREKQRTY